MRRGDVGNSRLRVVDISAAGGAGFFAIAGGGRRHPGEKSGPGSRRRGCGSRGQWPGSAGSPSLNCRPRHPHRPRGRTRWRRSSAIAALSVDETRWTISPGPPQEISMLTPAPFELRVGIDVGAHRHAVACPTAPCWSNSRLPTAPEVSGISSRGSRPMPGRAAWPVAVAMEGYNGHARLLDSLIRARDWRLFNVNNLRAWTRICCCFHWRVPSRMQGAARRAMHQHRSRDATRQSAGGRQPLGRACISLRTASDAACDAPASRRDLRLTGGKHKPVKTTTYPGPGSQAGALQGDLPGRGQRLDSRKTLDPIRVEWNRRWRSAKPVNRLQL